MPRVNNLITKDPIITEIIAELGKLKQLSELTDEDLALAVGVHPRTIKRRFEDPEDLKLSEYVAMKRVMIRAAKKRGHIV